MFNCLNFYKSSQKLLNYIWSSYFEKYIFLTTWNGPIGFRILWFSSVVGQKHDSVGRADHPIFFPSLVLSSNAGIHMCGHSRLYIKLHLTCCKYSPFGCPLALRMSILATSSKARLGKRSAQSLEESWGGLGRKFQGHTYLMHGLEEKLGLQVSTYTVSWMPTTVQRHTQEKGQKGTFQCWGPGSGFLPPETNMTLLINTYWVSLGRKQISCKFQEREDMMNILRV